MTNELDPVRLGLPSASSFPRLVACPGSVAMERGLPELEDEATTTTGNKVHAALHTGDDDELELSEKEIKERLSALEQSSVAAWREYYNVVGDCEVIRETRFWIRNKVNLDLVASAQPDVIYVGMTSTQVTVALCINFKTGFADTTPSERNWQCRMEALALWSERQDITCIRGGIVASRLVSKVDETDYDVDSLQKIDREVQHAVWRSQQPDAPLAPGSHCRWCRARGVCKIAVAYALVPQTFVPAGADSIATATAIGRMTPEQLAYVHARKSLGEQIFEGVSDRLKSLPKEELERVGFKLVPGNKLRDITDNRLAVQKLEQAVGVAKAFECVRISRTPAAEAYAEKTGQSLKSSKEAIDLLLADITTEREGNPRLKAI